MGFTATLKNNLGWFIICALTLFMPIYWFFINPVQLLFGNFSIAMASIGKLLSLAGFPLFALVLLLNTRLRFTENWFNGLDKTYRAHHIFGTLSFVFLLFHPLFLASQFLSYSAKDALTFLIPGASWPVNFGIFALLSMGLFLIITFFVKLKYENWKFSHQFLGLSFLLASLHVFLIESDVSRDSVLRVYTILMVIIGLGAYSYRTLLWRYLVRRYPYTVSNVVPLKTRVTELTLTPNKKHIQFIPGQFQFISLTSAAVNAKPHPFTISSAPHEKVIRLSIKELGDYTSNIKNVKVGDKAKIEGPFGRFCSSLYPKDQIWIAGGIGITPFLSMARSPQINSTKIDLYYSVKTANETVFLDELQDIAKKHKQFTIIPFINEKQGRITAEFIKKESKNITDKEIFICGPPPMMTALKEQFMDLGVKRTSIHMEEFALL